MTQSVDEMHRAVRGGRSPAFAELMDKVYYAMSPLNRAPLPRRYPEEIGSYVNALVGHALLNLPDLGVDLKKAVSGNFKQSPIVFYGTWGTPSARNAIIAIPTVAQGYTGRAK